MTVLALTWESPYLGKMVFIADIFVAVLFRRFSRISICKLRCFGLSPFWPVFACIANLIYWYLRRSWKLIHIKYSTVIFYMKFRKNSSRSDISHKISYELNVIWNLIWNHSHISLSKISQKISYQISYEIIHLIFWINKVPYEISYKILWKNLYKKSWEFFLCLVNDFKWNFMWNFLWNIIWRWIHRKFHSKLPWELSTQLRRRHPIGIFYCRQSDV